jgi:hypothetical protein
MKQQVQIKARPRKQRRQDDAPEAPPQVRPDIARRWFPQEGDRP